MRRVLLVNLNWCRPKDPPNALGGASIEANLRRENISHKVQSWNVNNEKFDWNEVVEYAFNNSEKNADVAIGAFVWNESSTQKIIRTLRKHNFPGRIILGGPQVSYTRKNLERFYPDCDVFIRGYGENALARYAKGERNVKGVHHAGEPDFSLSADINLDSIPSPFLTGIIKPQRFIRWETQRGCPFHCAFCQHREANVQMERKVFAKQRVGQEIEWICSNPIIKDIAVLDPTFNSGPLYLQTLRYLIDCKYTGKISFQCRMEMCTDEFMRAVELLNRSADVVLEFGVQTIHKDEQKVIQRPNNLKKAEKVMLKLNEMSIQTEISLIFGLPKQTVESFKSSLTWCKKVSPTKIVAFPLMLLRGTPLFERREELGLIESCDVAHSSIDRIQQDIPHVVSSPTFTFDEWRKMADLSLNM